MNKEFGFLAEHFNTIFKELFPQYPMYPSFSIWRMMTKIWVSIIRGENRSSKSL